MTDTTEPKSPSGRARPAFPQRAVVTAGMPYGNKDLHFGHVGGVFVHADVFARFLRDRIGPENVIFVSGTDCYGSPIVEEHRQLTASGKFSGTLEEFVTANHLRQRQTLEAYGIGLNVFAASSLSPFREIHEELGACLLRTLHAHGHVEKRATRQFYDAGMGIFLNGRQVLGRCPVEGCRSEKAYADECSLGHQYEPKDLIDPKSALTGQRPEMRDVSNWYVRMSELRSLLGSWLEGLRQKGHWRPFILSSLLEYFEPPTVHVTLDQLEALDAVAARLPAHQRGEGQAKSIKLIFGRLEDAERAKTVLGECAIRYRSGKTLVPFRLTGNLAWGLPVPDLDGLGGLTFWVWPESLWAPISFTAAYLEQTGRPRDQWREWWCRRDAVAYQFIGEDNIYFYGLAEGAIWLGSQGASPVVDAPEGQLQLPHLVANRHLLFLDKKASSSGAVKPPLARDLLNYYTADQLRAHFISLGLGLRSVSFRPKPLDPKAAPTAGDPVLKEGNLLSNSFNHAVRSCFYTAQKFFDGRIPAGPVSPDVLELSEKTILDYEQAMYRHEFYAALSAVADYIRDNNQRWSRGRPHDDATPADLRRQTLIDAFHMVRVAVTLIHPIAPTGAEKIREYLVLGPELWDWRRIFQGVHDLMPDPSSHRLQFLPPRVDFFEKHPSQLPT